VQRIEVFRKYPDRAVPITSAAGKSNKPPTNHQISDKQKKFLWVFLEITLITNQA
jgi:hypothetical protein